MKVLIVGGGGREHALAWKIAQSARVERVFVAPGNAGTASEPRTENVEVSAEDIEGLLRCARERAVDLTVVGPEAPLVAGIVDAFASARLRIFGPRRDPARLEGSKGFAKDFMARHGIPTAAYGRFTDLRAAEAWMEEHGAPMVVKADGLAAGKGVHIAQTVSAARAAARAMLREDAFGAAGRSIVVEEFLEGEEASFICVVDGVHVLPLASSQDHKALEAGDRGPNTGGMGAYSPAPVVTPEVHARILREIIEPTVRGMAAAGTPFQGVLYAGLMIGRDGTPRVLEFNCRLGDPETQPLLMRLRTDLVEILEAATTQRLHTLEVGWDPRVALGVVLTAGGYPGHYRRGDAIHGLEQPVPAGVKVFHAGTAQRAGQIVTDGGRVLCVCALGEDIAGARTAAYRHAERIHWEGMYYRPDIGCRALERDKTAP